ncbi:glycosyltransferase [uncultured Dokdonia sp.]|uniref:glycosyltransferase n=1 Tax=uncultured Dokdonia sp. TaxID=575653 RepID=UPI0026245A90|nr:glycosyltransferase [uncultured Dokdonia sp.]
MKILLIGEYSRFHNSLKEGLTALGHHVTLVGTGDNFKKFPVDIAIAPVWSTSNWTINKIRHLVYKLTKVDLALIETGVKFWKQREHMKGYDVVQFINSWSIRTTIAKEKKCITFLEQHNKTLFLSACGTDTPWIESLLKENVVPYHILTPYQKDTSLKRYYANALKYTTQKHKELYAFIESKVNAIIPTDMDYYLGLQGHEKATTLIPTPINLSKLDRKTIPNQDKIVLFHGINRANYIKKGNDVFEAALEIVMTKYPSKIEVITVESLPYTEYIKAYDKAHILLDQVYSHDQGYNALEAMAKGKVVFTGAGTHFKKHYQLDHTVAIDATPDPEQIASELEQLILHPERITEIGKNAKVFVEKYHDHIAIAQKYLDIWKHS